MEKKINKQLQGVSNVQLTQEQQEIIEAVRKGYKIIKINAFAGTGKTTTLVEIAKDNPDKKILYLAFNKSIQLEAQQKFPENTEAKTTHALAYRYAVKYFDLKNIRNEYKPQEILDFFREITYSEAVVVRQIFQDYCNSHREDFNHFENDLKIYAKELFKMIEEKKIEPTHSFYLKWFQLQLLRQNIKIPEYDIILLDEAQDTNNVTLSIFYNIPAKQKIVVGDKHQQIYSFRGSINAMQKIKAKIYSLTTSFRITEETAEKATQVLKFFKGEMKAIKGMSRQNKVKTQAIITRTNGKLIDVINTLDKHKIVFKTIRKPYEIFGLAMNLYKLEQNQELDHRYRYLNKFKELYTEEYISGDDLIEHEEDNTKEILGLINTENDCVSKDSMEGILDFIIELCEKTEDIETQTSASIAKTYRSKLFMFYQKAKEYYESKEEPEVYLTTAHTAKGLEWDKITLTDDFYVLDRIAKYLADKETISQTPLIDFIQDLKRNQVSQTVIDEINLYYVAITRSKGEVIDNTELDTIDIKRINEQLKYKIKIFLNYKKLKRAVI